MIFNLFDKLTLISITFSTGIDDKSSLNSVCGSSRYLYTVVIMLYSCSSFSSSVISICSFNRFHTCQISRFRCQMNFEIILMWSLNRLRLHTSMWPLSNASSSGDMSGLRKARGAIGSRLRNIQDDVFSGCWEIKVNIYMNPWQQPLY